MKKRLDIVITERGLAPSREKARAMIMAGQVLVDGDKVDKAGAQVSPEAELRIVGEQLKYASRGGLKLEKAVNAQGTGWDGIIFLDTGASHGGFCYCMLQTGAAKYYAVNVGMASLPGNCAPTRGWSIWSAPISAM